MNKFANKLGTAAYIGVALVVVVNCYDALDERFHIRNRVAKLTKIGRKN